jgi:hypothetical protein
LLFNFQGSNASSLIEQIDDALFGH